MISRVDLHPVPGQATAAAVVWRVRRDVPATAAHGRRENDGRAATHNARPWNPGTRRTSTLCNKSRGICGASPGDLIDWMEHEREKLDEAVEDMELDAKR